jgi:hypothetical protein
MKTQGSIPIEKDLQNSPIPNLPVEFALSRNLAMRTGLTPSDTPSNIAYVPLPTFAHVGGTIGNVDTKIDKTAIAMTIAKAAATKFNLPGKIGGEGGKLLQGIIGGGGSSTGSSTGDTNKATGGSAIQKGLQGLLGGGAKSNEPAGGNTNKPSGFNPFDLLKKK